MIFPRGLASLNVKFEEEKPPEGRVQRGLNDFEEFLELAKEKVDHVVVIQHLTRTELEKQQPQEGYYKVQQVCGNSLISCISLEPEFRAVMEQRISPFRGIFTSMLKKKN